MDDFYTKGKGTSSGEGRMLRLQLPICDRTITSEVAGDFSLPDYQPEIKRLLRVSATVQPPSHYVGGGAAEFSGTVDYCILYAGNDGQMYCFPTSAEYSFRVPLEATANFDLNDGLICYALCEPESIISRVGGPRRMSVKCRLRANVKAYGSYLVEEKRKGALPRGCREERLYGECEAAVSGYGISEPLVVGDEVLLEEATGEKGDFRIISGDAQTLIHEVNCGNGRVGARGEVVIKLLLQSENEGAAPLAVLRKLPFEGEILTDFAAVNGEAAVSGCCTELSLSMEDGRVVCEAELVLEARTQRREMVSYSCDWYAAGCESSCSHSEIPLARMLRCVNGNVTQSEVRSLEELGIDGAARVLDVAGVATVENVEADHNRFVMSGKCRYTLILSSEGEMSIKEVELPFRYTTDGAAGKTPLHYEAQAQVLSARARMDAQRLAIDAEIGVCMRLWGEQTMRAVSATTVGEPIERTAGEVILCYPSREDTLWSVGKRYHAPLDELIRKNGLNDEKRADDKHSLSEVRVVGI